MTSKQEWKKYAESMYNLFMDMQNNSIPWGMGNFERRMAETEAAFSEYVKCKVEEEQNADAESHPDKAAY